GYIYGKMHNIDIRQYGSGNAGTTNALRVLGKKAGLIVFFGDAFKTIFACLAAKMIFAGNIADGMIHNPNAVLLPLFAIIYICSYMVDIRCNEPLGRTFDTIVSQPHIKKIFLPALLLLEAAIWARNIIVHFT
ncbi:MAG: glycerol-3-phosphate acyltransferase, partial [Peptococcaceae bacterium]|nr:glycerol-3-phosphate acyltransferase [Peptococcaceae bacterium]